jgi:hypothetical protein
MVVLVAAFIELSTQPLHYETDDTHTKSTPNKKMRNINSNRNLPTNSNKTTPSETPQDKKKKLKKAVTPLFLKTPSLIARPLINQPLSAESSRNSISLIKKTGFQSFESESIAELLIRINIGLMTGNVITLDVDPMDTIGDLKERINLEQGISVKSQMIVFCGKELNDNFKRLKDYGIQDGSNLTLVIQMNGGCLLIYIGPGPPINLIRDDADQVMFLLCKQKEEIFVLEVHLKDGQRPESVTKHYLRFNSPSQNSQLFDLIGSNECFDISDLCEIQPVQDDNSSENMSLERPGSGESEISFVRESYGSAVRDSDEDIEELIGEMHHDLINLGKEWGNSLKDEKNMVDSKIRPATAISLMRLPIDTKPMIIIPKTRPSSAEKWIEGFKSHMESNEFIVSLKDAQKEQSFDLKNDLEPFPSMKRTINPLKGPFVKHNLPNCSKSKSTPSIASRGKTILSPNLSSSAQPLQYFTKKSPPLKQGQNQPAPRMKCTLCNKKLGPAQIFLCRCKNKYCAIHRYSDRHNCKFDHKTHDKEILRKTNPMVKNEKCIKL